MQVEDLGILAYRDAWAVQERVHEDVLNGAAARILLVEHPPVITMGRRGESGGMPNLIASRESLANIGVDLVQTDRGGDITFHGPGQLVVYPIIRLIDHKLSVGSYVRMLELSMIDALMSFGIAARKDEKEIGVWAMDKGALSKICALGVRIRRGISLHGVALNVTTDLSYFNLIVPCGLAGRSVTSMSKLLGAQCPSMEAVKRAVVEFMVRRINPAAGSRSG